MPPIHPGHILLKEFMIPCDLSSRRFAQQLRVSPSHLYEIIKGRRSLSADMALRLARACGTSPEFWLNLQQAYDLRLAEIELASELENIDPISPVPSLRYVFRCCC